MSEQGYFNKHMFNVGASQMVTDGQDPAKWPLWSG